MEQWNNSALGVFRLWERVRMASDLDAVFWVESVPVITFREGNFHVCYEIGKRSNFEIVLSPNTYLRALRRANQAADEFHERGEAVPIKSRGAH